MKKDTEISCFHEDKECQKLRYSSLDPRYHNLTEDFIFIDEEWGSLFYKYIGEMENMKAKETCSNYGKSVHLPIPRFSDENEFYRDHFGFENLWLDYSYDNNTGDFQTSLGHLYKNMNKYEWMNYNSTIESIQTGIKMTKTGHWKATENSDRIHAVCVYNILPSENCLYCVDREFCRYKDKKRQHIRCVCPTKAEYICEIDLPVKTQHISDDAGERLKMFKVRIKTNFTRGKRGRFKQV